MASPSVATRAQTKTVLAELLGTLLLTLTTNMLTSSDDGSEASLLTAAVGSAAAYTALVACTGGLLNPAATLTAALTGKLATHAALVLSIVQVTGAALGATASVALVGGARFGHRGPGCLPDSPAPALHVAGWETLLTALLVASYGSEHAPIAVGASQMLATLTAGPTTAAVLNPARLLAPPLTFLCFTPRIWVYLAAQLAGALIVAALQRSTTPPSSASTGAEVGGRTRAGRLVQEGLGGAREALLPHDEPPRPMQQV